MFKTSEDLMEELKKRGIEISRSWFYMILKDLKEDGIVSIKKRGKRYVYAIPEDSFEKVIEFFTDNYRTRNLLTASDIRRELKKKGFEISWSTLYGILKRVPSEYMITRKKFKKTYYFFKPEVIEYLVEKLRGE